MRDWSRSSVDPFTLKLNLGFLQIAKVMFNSLWLFPLRLWFIIIPSLIVGFGITFIIGSCYKPQQPAVPVMGWRRWLKCKVQPRVARWFLFGMGYHWIVVKGKLHDPLEVPLLIASPHSTVLDSFLIAIFTIPSVVARAENRRIPVIGSAMEILQPIFVHRDEQGSRESTVNEIRRRAESGGQWPHVLVYPEGTTTNANCIISYKRGAFVPGLPIQQILFRHDNHYNTLIWAERGIGPILGLFLTVCQFHNKLSIELLPPYFPSDEEKADSLLYARNMQHRAAVHLELPTTLHSYEDVLLLNMAERLGLPYTTGIVEFDWLKSQTKYTYDEVQSMLKRYCQMNCGQNNCLTAMEMADYLQLEPHPSTLLHRMLQSENCKGDVGLVFSDYVLALGTTAKPLATSEQYVTELCKELDQSNKGYICLSDIEESRLPWRPSYFDDMTYDQFQQFLLDNLEYVALADVILQQHN